tara:strand:- start:501 stop:2462 length:1962 start_codon:yes stop_codon:yes gene_type:complete
MINDYNKWSLDKRICESEFKDYTNSILIREFDQYAKIEENIKDAKKYFIKKSKQTEVDRMNKNRKRRPDVNTQREYFEEDPELDPELDVEEDPNDSVSDLPDNREFTLDDLRLSADKEQELLTHPDLQFVLDLVSGREKNLVVNPGTEFEKTYDVSTSAENYALIFLKFKIDQKADNDMLKSLYSRLTDSRIKKKLIELPLGHVSKYTKIKDGNIPGYELLGDHITQIELRLQGDWIRTSLISNAGIKDQQQNIIPGKVGFNQKKAFKEAPKEVQNKIISLASELVELDPSGREKRTTLTKLSSIRSLEKIIDVLEIQIASIGTTRQDTVQAHMDAYPGTSILYENKDIMLTTYRSPLAISELCIQAAWCVKIRGYGNGGQGLFYSYNDGGNVQYAIWDFSKSPSDNMSIVGFTITPDGKRREHADKNDHTDRTSYPPGPAKGFPPNMNTFEDWLDFYKIPESDKKEILNNHKNESNITLVTSKLYNKIDQKRDITEDIINIIRTTEKRVNVAGYVGGTTNSRFLNTLIMTEIESTDVDGEKIRKKAWEHFSDERVGGISNVETVVLFKILFKNSNYMTVDAIDVLINLNDSKSSRLEKVRSTIANNPIGNASRQQGRDPKEVLRRCEALMSNIKESNLELNKIKNNINNNGR